LNRNKGKGTFKTDESCFERSEILTAMKMSILVYWVVNSVDLQVDTNDMEKPTCLYLKP
jgi:hypothetical protein